MTKLTRQPEPKWKVFLDYLFGVVLGLICFGTAFLSLYLGS